MGTDLESNTAHRTEVSCLDLSRSCDRSLELVNVSMVPRDFHFPLTSRTHNTLGECLLFRSSLRGLSQKIRN